MAVVGGRQHSVRTECGLKHAIDFVRVTTGPLFNQLNPEKLGEYSELQEIGFVAKLFEEGERAAVQGLFKHISGEATVVERVLPTPSAQETTAPSQEVAAS